VVVLVAVTVEAGSGSPLLLQVSAVVAQGDVEGLTFLVGVAGGEAELLRVPSALALFVTNSSGTSFSSVSGTGVRLKGNTRGGLCVGVR
jgi:hypothetical protein